MKQRARLMHANDLISYNMIKKTDGDTANGEIPLNKIKPPEHFIEAQIQEGDSLQAIALRFHCSISELKRINHIQKDNEIFARRTIKVPVSPYSILTELIPSEPKPGSSKSEHVPIIHGLLNNTQSGDGNVQNNYIETKDDCSIDCNAVVMNSTLAPAVVPYTDETNDSISVSEDTKLLPNKQPKEPIEAVVVKQLTSQGADFGIKWFHLLGLVLIIGVLTPIILIILNVKNHEPLDDIPPLQSP